MADAIGRTLFRLFVSHRNLLEWVTAAQASLSATARPRWRLSQNDRRRRHHVSWLRSSSTSAGGDASWVAAPFVMLWIASPAVALWISRAPRVASHLSVSDSDARALRLVARRTWRFFETFVTAEDHMLPPDNFQEDPKPGAGASNLAHEPRPLPAGHASAPGILAGSEPSRPWSGWKRRSKPWAASSAFAATSTTGTTPAICARWTRATCPPWTAAISPRTSSPWPMRPGSGSTLPVTPSDSAAGACDALHLAREALQALPAHLRTQSILWQQLEEQLDDIATALRDVETSRGDIASPAAGPCACTAPRSWTSPARSRAKAAMTPTATCSSGRMRPTAPSRAGAATSCRRTTPRAR